MGAEVEVTLSSFYIDVYEVTNEQWQACVQAGACREPTSTAGYTGEPYYGDPAYANHPVIAITWFDAADYCAWAGGRLPTEAEWEMAARWDPITQQTTLYPWGDAPLEGRANTCGLECPLPNSGNTRDAYPQTAPVGSFEDGVSPVGAYDMAGNVAEWVADWYAAYPSGPLSDPTGPADGERRVVRGGAWGVPLSNANSVQRSRFTPDSDSLGLGVRCVKER
jgi:formylglycine-generating enzyme required for sulfatase activity